MTPARRQPPGVGTRRSRLRGQGDGTTALDAVQVAALLDSPEIGQLVSELAATRWTGRPGYPPRTMVGMALAKPVYALPTWTRTVALVNEHAALRIALGCPDPISVPSMHACYRFAAKLRAHKPLLDACLDRVTAALHEQMPDLGATVAIDASDLPAYANGQRYLYKGGPSARPTATPTPPGATARPSPPGRPAASTATSSTRPWTPRRAAAGLAGRDGQGSRVQLRRSAAGIGQGAGVPARDRRHGHGL